MILIFGLGAYEHGSGSSAALYLAKQGHKLIVTDLKTADQLPKRILQQLQQFPHVELILGRHRKQDIKHADLIVRNPGVPDNEYIQYARQLGKPIINDVGIFLEELRKRSNCSNVRIVGVTGTRGKSTTTALITAILRKKFGERTVHVGGNIGNSPLNFLSKIKTGDIVVLELSSWLLRDLHQPSFNVTVVTNLLRDHLNYYANMRVYQRDKERIFLGQTAADYAVVNGTDASVRRMATKTKANVIYFKAKTVNASQLLGKHSQFNIGAAWEVGKLLNVSVADMQHAIQQFKGVPNRLELIRVYKGRKFYNDTTATTPDATIAALRSFKQKVILIAGGNSKQLSLKILKQEIKRHVKTLILLPGNANKDFPVGIAVKNMAEAVRRARNVSKPGDIILLSPGVTWLPVMNEFERGKQFVDQVKQLS